MPTSEIPSAPEAPPGWSIDSWRSKPVAQEVIYDDAEEVARCVSQLRRLPPLVTSWEIERLKGLLADAQLGKRFVLQGGDCAESLDDTRPSVIVNKLKILLQMSLVLIHGGHRPVVRIGRMAGQYAKPRSSPTETRGDRTLPSYFGDLVNRPEFTAEARRADPTLMVRGYEHAALTLNFVRTLAGGGFADLHHPELWDLSFFQRADLPKELRAEYERTTHQLGEALRFMEALGENTVDQLTRVEFYTSHEGLNLHYESAQTRALEWDSLPRVANPSGDRASLVPSMPGSRAGWYDLTAHLPWIGERTRSIDGAHVEFFRGVRNPVGVKLGPSATPSDVLALIEALNPDDEPGKLVLITRMGARRVGEALPPLIEAAARAGKRVLWICDPMHGNTHTTASGIKTRSFDEVLREIELSFQAHASCKSILGGVHFELTGEDVTECVGGGISEEDLDKNYASKCDPRLNYRQALEMAFRIAKWMGRNRA